MTYYTSQRNKCKEFGFLKTQVVQHLATRVHLKFENASDLGKDSSGNDNDFTANG